MPHIRAETDSLCQPLGSDSIPWLAGLWLDSWWHWATETADATRDLPEEPDQATAMRFQA
jgi:hypothetical protein